MNASDVTDVSSTRSSRSHDRTRAQEAGDGEAGRGLQASSALLFVQSQRSLRGLSLMVIRRSPGVSGQRVLATGYDQGPEGRPS